MPNFSVVVAVNGMRTIFIQATANLTFRIIIAMVAGDYLPAFAGPMFDLNAYARTGSIPPPGRIFGSTGDFDRIRPGFTLIIAFAYPNGTSRFCCFLNNVRLTIFSQIMGITSQTVPVSSSTTGQGLLQVLVPSFHITCCSLQVLPLSVDLLSNTSMFPASPCSFLPSQKASKVPSGVVRIAGMR